MHSKQNPPRNRGGKRLLHRADEALGVCKRLLRRADEALYEAKRAGRDRVVLDG